MAYDSPKAAHIEIEIGGLPAPEQSRYLPLRWGVARYLETQGVQNLLQKPQRKQARELLRRLPDNLTNRGQFAFYLTYKD